MNRMAKVTATGLIALLTSVGGASAQQAQVQSPQGQKGQVNATYRGPIGQTPWFQDNQVRQQLKFNDEQFNRLNKAYSETYARYHQGINELGTKLTPEQRAMRTQDLNQNFYKGYSTSVNEIIADPQARTRYNQLSLQYRGYDAFNDPMVQEKLALTAEQRQKLGEYNQDFDKSMGELYSAYETDRDGVSKRFGDLRTREAERMNKVLNDQQRQTWRQLTGDPYQFQPNVYFQTTARKPGQ